jgi:hypothetical protein
MKFTEDRTSALSEAIFSRKSKRLRITFRGSGTYDLTGVSRYRRDAIVNGKYNGSIGQSLHKYALHQFPTAKVR